MAAVRPLSGRLHYWRTQQTFPSICINDHRCPPYGTLAGRRRLPHIQTSATNRHGVQLPCRFNSAEARRLQRCERHDDELLGGTGGASFRTMSVSAYGPRLRPAGDVARVVWGDLSAARAVSRCAEHGQQKRSTRLERGIGRNRTQPQGGGETPRRGQRRKATDL
jgi:hypothetical protein